MVWRSTYRWKLSLPFFFFASMSLYRVSETLWNPLLVHFLDCVSRKHTIRSWTFVMPQRARAPPKFCDNTPSQVFLASFFYFRKVKQRGGSSMNLKLIRKWVKHCSQVSEYAKFCSPYPLGFLQRGLGLWESGKHTGASELNGSCFLKWPRTIEVSFWKWNMESQNTHSGITSATIWVHFPHIQNYCQVPAKCLLLLFLVFNSKQSLLLFLPKISWSNWNDGWKITFLQGNAV